MADEVAPKESVYKWKKSQQKVGTRLTFNYNQGSKGRKTIGTAQQIPNK